MSTSVDIALGSERGTIHGFCDEKFQPVLDEFTRNFLEREEQGASVSLNVEGETVVDLWGGRLHPRQGGDWQEDTISVVHSVTKAAVSLCAHLLIADGKLDLHAKVARYWPEFAVAGKEDVTVAMMLNHSAGLPALRKPIKDGGYLDWDYMTDRLAEEEPFWRPGTRHGYHMSTFGWTVGELVRRASGLSLGEFFQRRVAQPLGIDFHIGLPESEHHRVARMMRWAPKKGDPVSPFTHALLNDSKSVQYLALLNNGNHKTDAPESYAAQFGAGGGIANARGIAGLYRPLANEGGDLVDAIAIERMTSASVAGGEDATLLMPTRFSLGFMLSMDNRHRPTGELESVIMGKHAFGHAGAGGSLGFADSECHLGFGYAMNKMGAGILLNDRGQSLVDAAYQCLGYTTCEPGYWFLN
ncbi:MAG: beta-lactamase family protein [Gammaproteobacteria bacterium]|jgi:CubicO group peptidase (beta-lactamase class C family)|nr:beta-lactamase family protein [Gammaproteobacteria bacterium]